jgi:hypothetical protein
MVARATARVNMSETLTSFADREMHTELRVLRNFEPNYPKGVSAYRQ